MFTGTMAISDAKICVRNKRARKGERRATHLPGRVRNEDGAWIYNLIAYFRIKYKYYISPSYLAKSSCHGLLDEISNCLGENSLAWGNLIGLKSDEELDRGMKQFDLNWLEAGKL